MEHLETRRRISISRIVEEKFKKSGIKRGSLVVFQSGAFGEAVFKVITVRKNRRLTLECIVPSDQVKKGYRLKRPVDFCILKLEEDNENSR